MVAHGGDQFMTNSCYTMTLLSNATKRARRHAARNASSTALQDPYLVDTAGEPAVAASASRAMHVHATDNEDVTHDRHRRVDGQHYYM